MNIFYHHLELCSPLFLMVLVGWGLIKIGVFDKSIAGALSKFVFRFLMPVMLFNLMSHVSEMPPFDWRVLIAFFSSCILLFIIGKYTGKYCFKMDSTAQVIMGMGAIFANNVQLGVPIIEASLGRTAMPTVSVLIIFNVLLLWTAATACVEFGRTNGHVDFRKFLHALVNILKNPIVLGIAVGTLWGLTGLHLPKFMENSVSLVSTATAPCALIVVGMGLASHSIKSSLNKGIITSVLKLFLQPLGVYFACRVLGLGAIETNAATVMACLPCAINLYIMAEEFDAERGMASTSIAVSTFISAITVPLTLTLLGIGY